ncbi:hypothetical protein AB0K48_59410, partial [Nonomuraea sp. NPDC055795]
TGRAARAVVRLLVTDGVVEGPDVDDLLHGRLPARTSRRPRGSWCGKAEEVSEALEVVEKLKERVELVGAAGSRIYNPGWHLALDLRNMLLVSECVARAALLRQESRGGHTRDDFPGMNPEWRRKLLVCATPDGSAVTVEEKVQPPMRKDLFDLFDLGELKKYLTEEELGNAE